MLTVHVVICFIALLAGAFVLIALWGGRRQPTWEAILILSTVLLNLTGFLLASPPETPTPDPARIVGVIDLVVVVIAALALYVYHLAHAWRGTYIVTIVLAVYFNAFVAVAQAFQKIGFLHVFGAYRKGAAVCSCPAADASALCRDRRGGIQTTSRPHGHRGGLTCFELP